MPQIAIREILLPEAVDAPGWEEYAHYFELYSDTQQYAYGTPDVRFDPRDALAWHLDPDQPRRMWIAAVDGVDVGLGEHSHLLAETADASWIDLYLCRGADGRGGAATVDPAAAEEARARLAEVTEEVARSVGSTRMIAYLPTPESPGPRLSPPTGSGSVPADDPDVRWMGANGWRLEQVERGSRLALPADAARVASLLAEAEAASPGYRVHVWRGVTPERWREDLAVLNNRMSTDAPSAGLEEPEDPWTAERVAESEARAEANGGTRITAAVEHEASGRLVGYTRLMVSDRATRPVSQWATLVLREHRGHRLGMRLKAANLQSLAHDGPARPSVVTWNAEENRHMLSVNEALGFEPIGYEGAWRKDLA
ncbi:MAG: hypothetical protein J0G30_06600 [Actinomycetales bacterium]|nr:hypothetical protein [Actinomycetales bacterium]